MTSAAVVAPLVRVVSLQPLGWAMAGGLMLVSVGDGGSGALRLSAAGAAVAAATAFVLDDPAAPTLAGSPTTLRVRRSHRIACAAVAMALWWMVVVNVATARAGGLPLRGRALELTVLAAVALAVSAGAATTGDRTGGGVAGAACSAVCFVSTFLPPAWWLPFPADPGGPGATRRLLVLLALAAAVLAWMSRDPARRLPG